MADYGSGYKNLLGGFKNNSYYATVCSSIMIDVQIIHMFDIANNVLVIPFARLKNKYGYLGC